MTEDFLSSLILASGSPRRKALLRDLGLSLKIIPAEINEIADANEPPTSFAKRMAREKAGLIARLHPERWVLGADTVVALNGRMYGKPKNDRQAMAFLQDLSGKTHQVITGFCLCHKKNRIAFAKSVRTQVTFKILSRQEIKWYVRTEEPRDKAGAYAIQGQGAFCIQKIRGSYTNVVGLPVSEVLEALEKYAGFRLGRKLA
ncbi:MAG TPA: Maf family protein [Thermodesulfobacteriota bacterium]|nr:Maf family protein [Thermodesulfobacteriota bacterium]